ncbi:unnamed protein product [Prorocentrum cordatum]|uniref:Pre-mRNA-splicing factor 18 n=1 Tax=Prorocentrum cordatum TaxID=2364126 RepID=A0ABN9SYC8_9DINO|nr:unnamed protein product [Polarella glacialis]
MEAAAPVAERSLVSSSLHREDVLVGGHAAVWGSFFDPEARRWGFACCRGTARLEPCPEAKAAARLLDGEPPDSPPGAREESDCAEDFLAAFVLYWFHAWASGSGAEARPDARAVQQTKEALLPLLQQLKARTLPQPLLRQLADFAELAGQREYSQANDVYVAITIGKALWHTHLDLGQQRAHWGGGSSLRTMQKQIVEKDHKNATAFDTDPAVQRYVHALKRLATHIGGVAPSDCPSKQGHVPAPAALPSEVGLPVRRSIRDSDGQGRVPEFVEPCDMPAFARDNARRLQFAVDQGGHSHPFQGIGSARGV